MDTIIRTRNGHRKLNIELRRISLLFILINNTGAKPTAAGENENKLSQGSFDRGRQFYNSALRSSIYARLLSHTPKSAMQFIRLCKATSREQSIKYWGQCISAAAAAAERICRVCKSVICRTQRDDVHRRVCRYMFTLQIEIRSAAECSSTRYREATRNVRLMAHLIVTCNLALGSLGRRGRGLCCSTAQNWSGFRVLQRVQLQIQSFVFVGGGNVVVGWWTMVWYGSWSTTQAHSMAKPLQWLFVGDAEQRNFFL